MKSASIKLFISLLLILVILMGLGIKGKNTFNYYQLSKDAQAGGPFESSGSNSRYALTEAMVENHSFFFTQDQAKFSAPDFVYHRGKFFSLFTPGVSFLAAPFYIFGKWIGYPQLATFSLTILLSVVNFFLIVRLAKKLGAGKYSALLGGFIFLFATNAFSYALTLTQHHPSTTILLLALLNATKKRTWLSNLYFGLLYAAGLLIDIPNAILLLPIGLYITSRHFVKVKQKNQLSFSIKLTIIGLLIGILPLLGLFGWYNYQLTGSPLKLGQFIGRSDYFEPAKVKAQHALELQRKDPFGPKLPFNPRNQIQGLYVLLISNERGWLFYSPIILLGILGLLASFKSKRKLNPLIISTILINIITYSMFPDPWGGWAFGPRYLIPATALLSAATAMAIAKYQRKLIFGLIFFVLISYSLAVNLVGAITTTQVPPKVEAVNLIKPVPYTYIYNIQLLQQDISSSLVYNLYFQDKITSQQFALGYFLVISAIISALYIATVLSQKQSKLA